MSLKQVLTRPLERWVLNLHVLVKIPEIKASSWGYNIPSILTTPTEYFTLSLHHLTLTLAMLLLSRRTFLGGGGGGGGYTHTHN